MDYGFELYIVKLEREEDGLLATCVVCVEPEHIELFANRFLMRFQYEDVILKIQRVDPAYYLWNEDMSSEDVPFKHTIVINNEPPKSTHYDF
jgi:hypothetical protein